MTATNTTALVLRRDWQRWNTALGMARVHVAFAAAAHCFARALAPALERAISDFVAAFAAAMVPKRPNAYGRRLARLGHKAHGYPPTTGGKRPLKAAWTKGHNWQRVPQIKGVRFKL